jgi:menaquinone-dependent protoporphyrinogen IX oxidase
MHRRLEEKKLKNHFTFFHFSNNKLTSLIRFFINHKTLLKRYVMKSRMRIMGIFLIAIILILPSFSHAQEKKGLLIYDTIYGSTIEVAYWIKALIGVENHLDVKRLSQLLTVKPYDYVIIGSYTRNEKPSKATYEFVETHQNELAKKEVAYFLTCGDNDETMVLKTPGGTPHLIAGRNYLFDIQEKFPNVKPVVIGGFGGRQVNPTLSTKDSLFTWLLGKLAKEGVPWEGLDIWESLIPEKVEVFANEIREIILGLPPRYDVEKYRGYWTSIQPASLTDPTKVKFNPKPYNEHRSTDRIFFTRSRIKGDLNDAISLLQAWGKQAGIDLREQKRSFFNVYYHAVKTYDGNEHTLHVVASTLTEDPGNVHISFRSYEKPDKRKGAEEDVTKAEAILWADGRKVEGEKRQTIKEILSHGETDIAQTEAATE